MRKLIAIAATAAPAFAQPPDPCHASVAAQAAQAATHPAAALSAHTTPPDPC